MERRVVVTGIGAVTPIGTGRGGLWQGVTEGRLGIRRATRFDASSFRCQVAGEVPEFDPAPFMEAKRVKRLDRYSQFAVASARMALADAALVPAEGEPIGRPSGRPPVDGERVGCCIGSALGGVSFAEGNYTAFNQGGLRAVDPTLAMAVFAGAASCNIAIEFGFSGPNTANSDSCASGTIAVGNALQYLRRGDADVMLAGGVEAPLSYLCFGAFDIIRAMAKQNDPPERACRPFDATRDGFVMAEGAAVLVLEELGHARRRGAPILVELLGYGLTNDAHHMTAPRPDGRHAARAIRLALRDACLAPEEIEAINAHASSTPLNDKTETLAIKEVFGERAYRIPVSGTKAMHGHSLGAVGAIEAAIGALTVHHGFVPPTMNLDHPDPECDLDYVPGHGRHQAVRTLLSNSFGFGGINACLVLGSPPAA
jgi:3-oxoacyl-[acyl-carrier-protein] synthase II